VDVPGFAPPRRVGTNVGAAQTAGPGGEMLAADVDKPWQFE
jgi:hypothetical protein